MGGGYCSIEATIRLLEAATEFYSFDRYVILQGADYPILSNDKINEFFEQYPDTEFIRAISDTNAIKEWYKYSLYYMMDGPWFLKKILNRINLVYIKRYFPFLIKKPYIYIDGQKCEIFRGWAHFAITDKAARYILKFYKTHTKYNNYFRHVYTCDESYFQTILYNSDFKKYTPEKGPVPEGRRSVKALLNVTYFEYATTVRNFYDPKEFKLLKQSGCLFFRKVSDEKSIALLDYIDNIHNESFACITCSEDSF